MYIYRCIYTRLPLEDFTGENAAEVELGVFQSIHPAELLRCLDFASKGEVTFLCNEVPFGEENVLPRTVSGQLVSELCYKTGCGFNNPQTYEGRKSDEKICQVLH